MPRARLVVGFLLSIFNYFLTGIISIIIIDYNFFVIVVIVVFIIKYSLIIDFNIYQ